MDHSRKRPTTASWLTEAQEQFDTNLQHARARRMVIAEQSSDASTKHAARFEERVWLTAEALAKARALEAKKRAPVSEADVFTCALTSGEGLARTEFDHGRCLNRLVALHYALDPRAIAQIPDAYTTNQNLQMAFGRLFAQALESKTDAHVMEWASGNRVKKRWSVILGELAKSRSLRFVRLTLTDFSDSTIPAGELRGLGFRGLSHLKREVGTAKVNLLQPLPDLQRSVDAILVTQGFDSIWSDEDVYYVKKGGKWYQGKCRLRVPKADPQRDEVLAVLRGEQEDTTLPATAFEVERAVFVEQILEALAESQVPASVRRAYKGHATAAFWYPGGIMHRAEEAFKTVLKPDGMLVLAGEASRNGGYCGEGTATRATSAQRTVQVYARMYYRLPSGAIYKHDEWPLVQTVLSERGYEVSITPIAEFISSQVGGDHSAEFVPDIGNHVMIIRKR